MTRRRRFALGGALIVSLLGSAATWRELEQHGLSPASLSAAPSRATFAYAWQKGKRYTYAIEWKAESALTLPTSGGSTEPMRAEIDVAGELVLRAYGEKDGAHYAMASLERLSRHRVVALGSELLPDDESVARTVDGRSALVKIAPNGALETMYLAKGTSPVFRMLLEGALGASLARVPDGGELPDQGWKAEELGPSGVATASYQAKGLHLSRRRLAYGDLRAVPGLLRDGAAQNLIAEAAIELSPAGHVVTIVDREILAVSDASGHPVLASQSAFNVSLVSIDAFDAKESLEIDPDATDAVHPGESPVAGGSQSAVLAQRVSSLTPASMNETIALYGASKTIPDVGRWLYRASGLVLEQSALAGELAGLFQRATTTPAARALVLEVLAAAGSAEAQAAMRAALESPAARAHRGEYALYVQRFSMVQSPDAATLDFLARAMRAGNDADARTGATYALGSAIGRRARAGDPDARRLGAELANDLRAARTPSAKRVLLAALGSAALPESAIDLAAMTKDADASVRASAIRSLRNIAGIDATQALIASVGDASPEVERAAIGALAERELDAAEMTALADAVTRGGTDVGSDAALVNALAPRAATSPEARRALAFVLARSDGDLALAARVRGLLNG